MTDESAPKGHKHKEQTKLRTMVLSFALAGFAAVWLLTVPSLTIDDLVHRDIVPTSVEHVTDEGTSRKSRLNEIVIHTDTLDYLLRRKIYAQYYTNEDFLDRIVPGEPLRVWVENDSDLSHIVLGLRNSHIVLDASAGMDARDDNRMWATIMGGFGLVCGLGYAWHLRHTIRRLVAKRLKL